MLAQSPVNAYKYLVKDPCSLFNQSQANPERLQSDGWGIGFYRNGEPRIYKSEKPVYSENKRFSSLAEAIRSTILIAHVRHASNPKGLPRQSLIALENTQPFTYKNYVFAHNGIINIPDEVAETLGPWKQKIKGVNDSEVYFWFIVKEMEEGKSLSEAIKCFKDTLNDLWQENFSRHSDKKAPCIGLNLLFSEGERLYAYCDYDKQETEKSYCYKDQDEFQMCYLHYPRKLIVASEKTNLEDRWRPLESNQLLTGQVRDGKVEITLQRI